MTEELNQDCLLARGAGHRTRSRAKGSTLKGQNCLSGRVHARRTNSAVHDDSMACVKFEVVIDGLIKRCEPEGIHVRYLSVDVETLKLLRA